MKDNNIVLELIIVEKTGGVGFSINTNVKLTEEECNEIVKIYTKAWSRTFEIDMKEVEDIKPDEFRVTEYNN